MARKELLLPSLDIEGGESGKNVRWEGGEGRG
jgi:hypothetical protein